MISFILAASLIVRLAAAAPLVPRAPTSISFRGPESDVRTCSAPVTLSWSIEDDQSGTDPETVALARVVVSSVDGDFTHTIDGVVRRTSIVWDTVDVPPGRYTVTGVLEGTDVDIEVNASSPFTVVSGESLDCIPSSTSSTQLSTTGRPTSSSTFATSSTTTTTPTILAESQNPSSTTATTPQAKTEGVQPALVAAIVASILIVSIAGFSILYYRVNRAKEHANIEYPLPNMNGKDTESLDEGRRSSDTVVEVKARAPTPVSILSRTTTKHAASLSEVDLVKRQELLRAMGRG